MFSFAIAVARDRESGMKLTAAALLVLGLVLSLTGCEALAIGASMVAISLDSPAPCP